MTINEIIKKYNMTTYKEQGQEFVKVNRQPSDEEVTFIKANKQEIITVIKAQREEEAREARERKEATVTFMAIGWESHEISIDTRKDINEQIERYAQRYSDDLTIESIRNGFLKAAEGLKIQKDIVEKQEKAEVERVASAFESAKVTGEKRMIERWSEECNDSDEQCDLDIVTRWAMPDGTITYTRQHTW